jgi:hypothetical protein
MLRGTYDAVFHDATTIKPGAKWAVEIEKALRAADLVVLFWCVHSSASAEVRREYQLALDASKSIMPLLLDATPLPDTLKQFQWVDFRDLVSRNHRTGLGPIGSPHTTRIKAVLRSLARHFRDIVLACIPLLLLVLGLLTAYQVLGVQDNDAETGNADPTTVKIAPPVIRLWGLPWPYVILLAMLVLTLALLPYVIADAYRGRLRRRIGQKIAGRLQAEFLKRGLVLTESN